MFTQLKIYLIKSIPFFKGIFPVKSLHYKTRVFPLCWMKSYSTRKAHVSIFSSQLPAKQGNLDLKKKWVGPLTACSWRSRSFFSWRRRLALISAPPPLKFWLLQGFLQLHTLPSVSSLLSHSSRSTTRGLISKKSLIQGQLFTASSYVPLDQKKCIPKSRVWGKKRKTS